MSANGRTHLMRADLTTRELTALRTNVECPSLSPDETRIAHKKRVGADWQLRVLHLQTGQDTALAAPPASTTRPPGSTTPPSPTAGPDTAGPPSTRCRPTDPESRWN
ncbi:TolB-like translocation protein [Streptomyces erythrochromogenes]|uniref:hypothetical protein n=1 Tax=Streptomyces erythrochromogenes TaxID=285574 RepID=UPI0036763A88